jgi:D-amino peptidase
MKVFIMTDLEGVSGVTSFVDETYPTGKYYEHVKHLLTAELNAAAEGLLEAGATDILAFDAHGPGGIIFEEIHPAIKLMHGRPLAPMSVRNEIVKSYDVCMMLGQHAMAGTVDGTLNHTQSSQSIDYYKLNGKYIGEIAQFALHAGALGLPMFCLTGDEAACREAQDLIPGISTISVKKGLSRTSAISLAPAEARRKIREGVRDALLKQKTSPIKPLVWQGPFVLEKRFFHSMTADGYDGMPNTTRIDSQTVQIKGENILDIIYA